MLTGLSENSRVWSPSCWSVNGTDAHLPRTQTSSRAWLQISFQCYGDEIESSVGKTYRERREKLGFICMGINHSWFYFLLVKKGLTL